MEVVALALALGEVVSKIMGGCCLKNFGGQGVLWAWLIQSVKGALGRNFDHTIDI
jgi:hypothetical protein